MQRCSAFLAATALCCTALCCLSADAGAVELAGTFTGTAVNSYIGMYPSSSTVNFNGVGVTGTFSFSGNSYTVLNGTLTNYTAYVFGPTALTFNLLGSSVAGTYTYSSTAFGAELTSGPSGQGVRIFSQQIPGDDYTDGGLFIAGTGFFDPANPLSLHPGTVNYAQSVEAGAFGSRFVFGTGLQLTSVTFATSVPEPGTILTVITGLVGLAGVRTARWRIGAPSS